MGKKKILIVDDNSMIRALFAADFEDDFDIEVASCGIEGIEAAVRARPDLILLDINMPDLSGMEVTRQLADRAETKQIPIVVITASEHNSATEKRLQPFSNFKGFLSKLTPTDKIREVINKVLSSRRQ